MQLKEKAKLAEEAKAKNKAAKTKLSEEERQKAKEEKQLLDSSKYMG